LFQARFFREFIQFSCHNYDFPAAAAAAAVVNEQRSHYILWLGKTLNRYCPNYRRAEAQQKHGQHNQ
jgi:hypothetical protein